MKPNLFVFLLIFAACAPIASPDQAFLVRTHPDGPLFVGDQVSFEVITPADFKLNNQKIAISVNGQSLAETEFGGYGIGGRSQATFFWVWNTADLQAGDYLLNYSVLPDGPHWQETLSLLPRSALPYPEPNASWQSLSIDCCIIYTISGTDAARDIEMLAELTQTQANLVEERIQTQFDDKISVTFIPRVVGHGGFATEAIFVSYLDENYAGQATQQIIHHEMVHKIDAELGGNRTTMLVEGLAVWLSQGHFKVEPILPRAAALIELGWYIPLTNLADEFYFTQHEVGYLEAAALTGYLIEKHGFTAFMDFAHDIPQGTPSAALNDALQKHFHYSLEQLESEFKEYLMKQAYTTENLQDVRLTVSFYDTVRRYQIVFDPSAYFLTAWLPDATQMREQGIVADYLRKPQRWQNQWVENGLVLADQQLRAGQLNEAEFQLWLINRFIDLFENK